MKIHSIAWMCALGENPIHVEDTFSENRKSLYAIDFSNDVAAVVVVLFVIVVSQRLSALREISTFS